LAHEFCERHAADAAEDVVASSLALVEECLTLAVTPEDRAEIVAFMPRVLRDAIALGAWEPAYRALTLLQSGGDPDLVETLFAELGQASSITTGSAVKALDEQDASQLRNFLRLARTVGEPAGAWLMQIISESRQQRVRRALVAEIATLWVAQPECLETWLADERWYVARNAAHILGLIATRDTIPLLAIGASHPEFRVRREVIDALGRLDPERARPLLFGMLENADSRTFCAALRQLSAAPGPRLAALTSAQVADDGFAERPAEEQRAVFSALAACGDDVLPVLAGQLNRASGWMSKHADVHRQAVARCIARIGSPAAIGVLTEGARSRNASVRRACVDALSPGAMAA
jgi:HEAT repeat protein